LILATKWQNFQQYIAFKLQQNMKEDCVAWKRIQQHQAPGFQNGITAENESVDAGNVC